MSLWLIKIVAEEPNKNYFSLLDAIPKRVNAIWELARGFIIPYTRGADYKEGALLRVIRLIYRSFGAGYISSFSPELCECFPVGIIWCIANS